MHEHEVTIRSKKSGLVLDVLDGDKVVLNHYNGKHTQKWHLHHHKKGTFIIRNAHHQGKCLDVSHSKKGGQILVYDECGGNNQLWYINSDDTIGSALGNNLVLDIKQRGLIFRYEPEQELSAWPKHNRENQLFMLE